MPKALDRGRYFWRLYGRTSSKVGTEPSVVWPFTVHASSRGATSGTVLDVNGDGYADVAIASSKSAQVVLFSGAPAGLATHPATSLRAPETPADSAFAERVASAGDVDGDGYGDLVVAAPVLPNAAYLYRGGPSGLAATPKTILGGMGQSQFGIGLAAAGDVDGDGYSDVVVGSDATRAWLYRGGPSGLDAAPSVTLQGPAKSGFGYAVAGALDVDGDGYSDLAVGARFQAAVHVYHGSAKGLGATPRVVLTGKPRSQLGCSIAGAGDINGDGYSDLLVGACGADEARIYCGSPAGLVAPATFALRLPGGSYPRYVAGAGDVNGDGYDDVLLGALSSARAGGAVWLALGSPTGPQPLIQLHAPDTLGFGPPMAGAGDINGDGYDDLVVSGGESASAVYVYLGEAQIAAPAWGEPKPIRGAKGSGFGSEIAGASF